LIYENHSIAQKIAVKYMKWRQFETVILDEVKQKIMIDGEIMSKLDHNQISGIGNRINHLVGDCSKEFEQIGLEFSRDGTSYFHCLAFKEMINLMSDCNWKKLISPIESYENEQKEEQKNLFIKEICREDTSNENAKNIAKNIINAIKEVVRKGLAEEFAKEMYKNDEKFKRKNIQAQIDNLYFGNKAATEDDLLEYIYNPASCFTKYFTDIFSEIKEQKQEEIGNKRGQMILKYKDIEKKLTDLVIHLESLEEPRAFELMEIIQSGGDYKTPEGAQKKTNALALYIFDYLYQENSIPEKWSIGSVDIKPTKNLPKPLDNLSPESRAILKREYFDSSSVQNIKIFVPKFIQALKEGMDFL
jgi:hypothetical protein